MDKKLPISYPELIDKVIINAVEDENGCLLLCFADGEQYLIGDHCMGGVIVIKKELE